MTTKEIKNWIYGIVDDLEPNSIPAGSLSAARNFLTKGDKMELRLGSRILGVDAGTGSVRGLHVGVQLDPDATQILWRKRGRKIEWYDEASNVWTELGSNVLPVAAQNDHFAFDSYGSQAGAQVFGSSPNSSIYKIMCANPGTILDLLSTAFRGYLRIKQNRMFLWRKNDNGKLDEQNPYLSWIDGQNYTVVDDEAFGEGDGATTAFTKILNFKGKAFSTLTSSGVNVSNNDTVTIDARTYTFKTALTPAANEVLIGTDAAASLANLKKAINRWGTPGTEYGAATTVHPTVEASTITSTTLLVLAKTPGTAGNAIVTTKVAVTLSWTAGTLASGAADKKTCFGVIVTAGSVVIADDRNGGGTSPTDASTLAINYITGEVTATFAVAPTDGTAITVDYLWEDSTDEGIADFSFSSPTRLAGEGNVFLQGDGGPLQGIETYGDVEHCFHAYKDYALTLSVDDTEATNLIFRDREGIPNWRAVKGTSIGIFFVNAVDIADPKIKLLTLEEGSTAVQGKVISANLNLSGYRFDQAEVMEWGDYITVACRTSDSTINNRYLMYHKEWGSFDAVDFWGYVSRVFNGALVVGESISGNVIEAFSGHDDDGAAVDGFMETNEWDLEFPGHSKRVKSLELEGEIGPLQIFDVLVSVDKGPFISMGQIRGDGDYIDRSQAVTVGSLTMGRGEIGGGGSGIDAYHYFRKLKLRNVDRFERIKVRLSRGIDADTATDGIGYFSLSTLRFRDVRIKNTKLPRKYR